VSTQEANQGGLRGWLNANAKSASAIGGAVVAIALIYIAVTLLRTCSPSVPGYSTGTLKYWFATEDGQNLYADDALLIPPFQKDGKTFYRAYVYKCPSGTQFVNHIEMYPPDIKPKLEEIKAKSGAPLLEYGYFSDKTLVKRPGVPRWLAYNQQDMSARYATQRPQSRECSGDQAVQVNPPGQ
jgi:hypothetical protein